jgi:hypothetical protein
MKNYQATRGKIKNYLDALKQRFSTSEWRNFEPNELCKEFKVSFILPQILKKEGYYQHYYKDGKSFMMLSQNIKMSNEVTIHNKLREYCNKSAKKIALKKKKIKAKNIVQPKFNFNKKEKLVKVMSVSVGLNYYNSVIADCKSKGLTVSKWMFNKLGASENVVPIEKTKNVKPELVKKAFLQQTPTNTKPNRRGRPLSKQFNVPYNNKEKVVYNSPIEMDEVYNSVTIHSIESAETKIKSLETIMSLYNNGVINHEELQSLKVGILNK